MTPWETRTRLFPCRDEWLSQHASGGFTLFTSQVTELIEDVKLALVKRTKNHINDKHSQLQEGEEQNLKRLVSFVPLWRFWGSFDDVKDSSRIKVSEIFSAGGCRIICMKRLFEQCHV